MPCPVLPPTLPPSYPPSHPPRFHQYARSKLANVLFTAELQRRYGEHSGIQATSISPGFVNTGLFRGLPWYAAAVAQLVAPVLGRTPQQVRGGKGWERTGSEQMVGACGGGRFFL